MNFKINERISTIGSIASIIGGIIAIASSSEIIYLIAIIALLLIVGITLINKYKSPYEFKLLLHEITLELMDKNGKKALHKSSSKLQILKNNTFYYIEGISSDGNICNAKTNLGVIESEKRENGLLKYYTTLERKRKKGEIVSREFQFEYINSFENEEEYYKYTQVFPGNVVRIIILFPIKRQPKDFWVEKHIGHYSFDSQFYASRVLIDNKNAIELIIPKIEINESYCIKWRW